MCFKTENEKKYSKRKNEKKKTLFECDDKSSPQLRISGDR